MGGESAVPGLALVVPRGLGGELVDRGLGGYLFRSSRGSPDLNSIVSVTDGTSVVTVVISDPSTRLLRSIAEVILKWKAETSESSPSTHEPKLAIMRAESETSSFDIGSLADVDDLVSILAEGSIERVSLRG